MKDADVEVRPLPLRMLGEYQMYEYRDHSIALTYLRGDFTSLVVSSRPMKSFVHDLVAAKS